MNSTEIEKSEENKNDKIGDDREISEIIQSKCALAAVCIILIKLPFKNEGGLNFSKKKIRFIIKSIYEELYLLEDKLIINENISGNLASLIGAMDGIKNSKIIPKGKHYLLLQEMSCNLMKSLKIGYDKFYGGSSGK